MSNKYIVVARMNPTLVGFSHAIVAIYFGVLIQNTSRFS